MEQPSHPPLSALDQLAAGLLTPEKREDLAAHLSACASCSARLSEIERERAAFLASHPPAQATQKLLERQPEAAPLFGGRPWLLGLPAIAALALVLIHREAPDVVRFKGSLAVSLWVHPMRGRTFELRAQGSEDAQPEPRFEPGDELRVRMTAPSGGIAELWAVDARGEATLLKQAKPKAGAALDWPLRIDERQGPERIFVLFSASPVAESVVRGAVRAAFGAAGSLEAMKTLELGPVEVRSYWLPKAERTTPPSEP